MNKNKYCNCSKTSNSLCKCMSNYGQTLITVETLHSLVKYYKMNMKLMIGKPLSLNNGHEVKLQYNRV